LKETHKIDTDKLAYNRHHRYYSPDYEFVAPKEMEEDSYKEGKEYYELMKKDFDMLGAESFFDAL